MVRLGTADTLMTIDGLVEGTHFEPGWLTPRQIGRKCVAINASDIAAMGGTPRWALVALAAPADMHAAALLQLQNGIVDAARALGVAVVGGNLTRSKRLSVTIALLGCAPPQPLTRCGAQPGDLLYVSGRLGDAARGVRWLIQPHGAAPEAALRRFRNPTPRLALGQQLAEQRLATAMIDISDGLIQDLGHLCEQSGCAAEVDVRTVPCAVQLRPRLDLVLAGGEDYELLFTAPASRRAALLRAAHRSNTAITCIGRILPGGVRNRIRLLQPDGSEVHLGRHGFDHFHD